MSAASIGCKLRSVLEANHIVRLFWGCCCHMLRFRLHAHANKLSMRTDQQNPLFLNLFELLDWTTIYFSFKYHVNKENKADIQK